MALSFVLFAKISYLPLSLNTAIDLIMQGYFTILFFYAKW